MRKIWFSALVLLTAVLSLGTINTGLGQSSFSTTVMTATSIGFMPATTSYQTSTVTLQALTQLSRMVNVGPAPGGFVCNYLSLTYTVKDPGYVFGHFNASSAIRFYFLTDVSFQKWWLPYLQIYGVEGGKQSCSPPSTVPRSDLPVSIEDALGYSFEVHVSKAGLYDFLFLNLSPTQTVAVSFSANTGQTATTTTTFAMVSYSTITQPFVRTSTIALGSISPQATQSSFFLLGQNGLLIYATLGSIAVIASVLVLRRSKKRAVTTSVVETKPLADARTSHRNLDELLLTVILTSCFSPWTRRFRNRIVF